MPEAVVYLRVSKDEQADSRAGLNAQVDDCRAFAERTGLAIRATRSDEGLSGETPIHDRPGLVEAIGLLRKGDVLLVAKRDRLARGDIFLIALIEAAVGRQGARVVSAAGEGTEGDDPSHVLMRRLVDAFAEHELLRIRLRTRDALAAMARRGERTGQVPLGKRLNPDGVTLADDPSEQELIETIRRLAASGTSRRGIAAALNERGIPSKNAGLTSSGRPHRTATGRWSKTTVGRIIDGGK